MAQTKSGKTGAYKVKKHREFVPTSAVPWRAPFKVICSECYEEFIVTPKEGIETIVCPECDHGAKAPTEDFLRKLGHRKRTENKKLLLAVSLFGAMIVLGLVWMFLMVNEPAYIDNTGLHYFFVGALILCFVLVIYFGVGYEGSRYEVYF